MDSETRAASDLHRIQQSWRFQFVCGIQHNQRSRPVNEWWWQWQWFCMWLTAMPQILLSDIFPKRGNGCLLSPIHTADETKLLSRRRCVHEFATTADGFGDANAQRSRRPWPSLQYCSQWVTTADGCVHTDDTTKLSPTSCEFVYTPPMPTRLDSFVSSASAVCIGL